MLFGIITTRKKNKRAVRRGAPVQTPRKKFVRQLGIGVLIIALIAALLTGVWYGTRIDSLTVKGVSHSGSKTIQSSEIEARVNEVLDGTFLRLVPKRFNWFLPTGAIENKLLEHDRIAAASADVVNGKVQVRITEYVPHALWCPAIDARNCVFVDLAGYAFEDTPQLSGGAFLRYVTAEQTPTKNVQAFDPDFIAITESFADLIEAEKQFVVSYVEETSDDDVVYHLTTGARLITGPTITPQVSFDNLLTVLDAPDFTHITQDNFEYIDLRFGNKVYVQEETLEAATSTVSSTTDAVLQN